MSKCGIEKYDELPSRVALIDVDHARASLKRIREAEGRLSLFWAGLERGGPINGLLGKKRKMEERIFDDLENAYEIYHHDRGCNSHLQKFLSATIGVIPESADKSQKNKEGENHR